MQNWCLAFYPERPDLLAELDAMAADLHGRLPGNTTGQYSSCKGPIGDIAPYIEFVEKRGLEGAYRGLT